METASRPILHKLGFGGSVNVADINNQKLGCNLCKSSVCFSSRSSRLYGSRRSLVKLNFDRFVRTALSGNPKDSSSSQRLALLLEVEGVLIDVNRSGHRQAFNVAFKKLGLDCANWTEPVYSDLARKSAGAEERMLVLYFNRIGWPTSVATSEKEIFMKNVLREKKNALDDLIVSDSFPLRPGAVEFIDEALKEGMPVVIITAYDVNGEKVARSIVGKLGADRISKIQTIGIAEVEQSFYGQLVFGKGVSSSLDEQLTREVNKAATAEKLRIAEEVASMLKLKVELNTSSDESQQKIVSALRAGAEFAEVPVCNCLLVVGSQIGVAAAERIGMPCVVLRSSLTSRAEFPNAMAVMDGFGGADLSISRLRRKMLP